MNVGSGEEADRLRRGAGGASGGRYYEVLNARRMVPDACATAPGREMEEHIARCPSCGAKCDSLQRTLALCRAAPLPEVPKAVQADVRRALQKFIELHE